MVNKTKMNKDDYWKAVNATVKRENCSVLQARHIVKAQNQGGNNAAKPIGKAGIGKTAHPSDLEDADTISESITRRMDQLRERLSMYDRPIEVIHRERSKFTEEMIRLKQAAGALATSNPETNPQPTEKEEM